MSNTVRSFEREDRDQLPNWSSSHRGGVPGAAVSVTVAGQPPNP